MKDFSPEFLKASRIEFVASVSMSGYVHNALPHSAPRLLDGMRLCGISGARA